MTQDGRIYPRCEQFAYREIPAIQRCVGMSFGPWRSRVLGWLKALGVGRSSYGHQAIGSALRWLDYGRPVKKAQDWVKLLDFVSGEWDTLGGDEGIGTLLAVVASEAAAQSSWQGQDPFSLVNALNGETEEFVGIDFLYVQDWDKMPDYTKSRWPKGWMQPWKK